VQGQTQIPTTNKGQDRFCNVNAGTDVSSLFISEVVSLVAALQSGGAKGTKLVLDILMMNEFMGVRVFELVLMNSMYIWRRWWHS
jgi:hypothetical protein